MQGFQLSLRLDPNSIRKLEQNVESASDLTSSSAKNDHEQDDAGTKNQIHGSRSTASKSVMKNPSEILSVTSDLKNVHIFERPAVISTKSQTRKRKRILEDDESSGEETKVNQELHDDSKSMNDTFHDPFQNMRGDVFEESGLNGEEADPKSDHDLDDHGHLFSSSVEESYTKLKRKTKDLMPKSKRARWSEDGPPFPSAGNSETRPGGIKRTKAVRKAERKMERFLKTREQDDTGYAEILRIVRERVGSDQIPSLVDAGDVIIEMEHAHQSDPHNPTATNREDADFTRKKKKKKNKGKSCRTDISWEEVFRPVVDVSSDTAASTSTDHEYSRLNYEINFLLNLIQPPLLEDEDYAGVASFLSAIIKESHPSCELHPTGMSKHGMVLRNAAIDIVLSPNMNMYTISDAVEEFSDNKMDKDTLLCHIKLFGGFRFSHVTWLPSKSIIPGDILTMYDTSNQRTVRLIVDHPAVSAAGKLLATWLDRYGTVFSQLVVIMHFIYNTHEPELGKSLRQWQPVQWDVICIVAAFFGIESHDSMSSLEGQNIGDIFLQFAAFWAKWIINQDVAQFDGDSSTYVRRRLTEDVEGRDELQLIIKSPFGYVFSPHMRTFQERILNILSTFDQHIQTNEPPSLETILGVMSKKHWTSIISPSGGQMYFDPSLLEMDIDSNQA